MKRSMSHDARQGRTLQWIGLALLVFGAGCGFLLWVIEDADPEVALRIPTAVADLVLLSRPVILLVAFLLIHRGKAYASRAKAASYTEAIARGADQRPPVLYLRPFKRDKLMSERALTAFVKGGMATNEEQLAAMVEPIGPLIAIGVPGEKLPRPGAMRAYASDAEWRDVVRHWLASARLIILRPGMSEGLWWEIRQAFSTVSPERVLILMTRAGPGEYEPFVRRLHDTLNIVLPSFKAMRRCGMVSGLFEFDAGWQSHFFVLRAPYWRSSLFQPLLRDLNYAMKPVFARLGVVWSPSPVSVMQVVRTALLAFLALMAVWVLSGIIADL